MCEQNIFIPPPLLFLHLLLVCLPQQSAACVVLQYILHTQRDLISLHIKAPTQFTQESHMAIDTNTRRALELTRSVVVLVAMECELCVSVCSIVLYRVTLRVLLFLAVWIRLSLLQEEGF